MKRCLLAITAILVLTSGLTVGCSQPTTTPTMPSASPGVPQDWQSYDNESLGIAFRYPDTYTLLLDDPINSGIQLESESINLGMIANPLSLSQSIIQIWPQLVAITALAIICFAISYIIFMKQEIRST